MSFKGLRKRLSSQRGVFDLPSVLVASLIGVILIGVVTVSVVGVSRNSFDNAAKSRVSAIVVAQKTFFATNDRFGSLNLSTSSGSASDELVAQKLVQPDASSCVVLAAGGASYQVAVRSQTGNIFYADSTSSTPEKIVKEVTANKYCLP